MFLDDRFLASTEGIPSVMRILEKKILNIIIIDI